MKKYKVLTLKPNNPFKPEELEQDINGYAEQGWRVITSTSGQFYTGAFRNEIIIILEKDAEIIDK
jgi:hypothetical protein